jgi:hypothetical protein
MRKRSRKSGFKLRSLFKWTLWFCLLCLILGVLSLGGVALATHYIFQEPAYIIWSRYLEPEFRWQRQKYPSVRWAFDLVEPLVIRSDPRDRFAAAAEPPALNSPADWRSGLLGPRTDKQDGPPPTVLVSNVDQLKHAIEQAKPGTVIEVQPGTYNVHGRNLSLRAAGTAEQPIVLRAAYLGAVRLRFNLLEGFHVLGPHWTMENFIIEGICKNDSYCEHAFHVVGDAVGTVIRNNWVVDFNSSVKVNGKAGHFPDDGVIEHNAFLNSRPRNTSNPVTLLDIVSVSGWQVRRNLITDFAKAGGNHTSYGTFFKGAGEHNIFEQNLIRCEWQHSGGARIGFSFGDGGTGKSFCRDKSCEVEHRGGIVRNNIIMSCPNEVGIYLNKSAETLVNNNALIGTRGIDLRSPQTYAKIVNNIIDGRILVRDGGRLSASHNILSPMKAALLGKVTPSIYSGPVDGDFRLKETETVVGQGLPLSDAGLDLCGQPLSEGPTDIGPFQYGRGTACEARLP